ncbi:short chain dehydrogenase domain-containing protein [Trichoderma breve]|uniref:Short chain dehydrogenase domain-containing protein n=1 Tax=Trichoderma breve TaxID=2034170 RepID=A0A9W9EBB5_9HYPO|nr:short chain dehydrogenase domain-containing protein [Trichoderma breve]KAJ4863577.1 short chain dehydrogenase domain-containing protein [Trichoderma breve]
MARIWFVTGSSKGLGLAIVEAALADGDNVVATARNPATVNHLVEKYGPDRILPLALDVANNEQVESTVKAAVDKFGRIDVVVNNAGYAIPRSLEDSSIDIYRDQIDVNLLGTVYVSKAVTPILRKQKSGRILQVSSVGGRMATPGLSAYQAAKWAVGGFSGVLAKELSPFGIKITVLEPGGMKTDWAGFADDEVIISEPYQQSVGEFQKIREQYRNYRSEPAKVADVIVKISKEDDPPLRLLLGPETFGLAKQVGEELAASDEKWKAATLLEI